LDFYSDFLFTREKEKVKDLGKKVFQDFEKICKHINNSNFSENELEILPVHLNKFINVYDKDDGNSFFKSILLVIKEMKKNSN
jgi:hypothetical protein